MSFWAAAATEIAHFAFDPKIQLAFIDVEKKKKKKKLVSL